MLSATTNTAALTAQRFLNQSSGAATSSAAKMSSGSRIVKASDDASSLAIGNKLRADVAALEQASRNASQGASLLQVANGAMDSISNMLIRLKTLATQVVNGTLSTTERQFAQQEFSNLISQVDNIANQTRWNGVSMLNGGDRTVASTNALLGNIAAQENGLNAGNSDYFGAAPFSAFTGNVQGIAEDVIVTDIGGQYEIDIEISGQIFRATVAETAPIGTTIEFRSISNDHNGFAMTTAGNAFVGNAPATIEQEFEDLFELTNANAAPASFQAAALTDANAALVFDATAAALTDVITATGAAEDGIYTVTSRYDAATMNATIRLMSDTGLVLEAVVEDPASITTAHTVSFSNGIDLEFAQAEINALVGANIDGVRFEVTAGAATTSTFQIGEKSTDTITIGFTSMTTAALNLDTLDVETAAGGTLASAAVSEAISKVNNAQAQIGAIQSRMEHIETNLATIIENLTAAKGTFTDVDMAKEMIEFTKQQTLMQTGISMLAQANQMPQQLLQLIQ